MMLTATELFLIVALAVILATTTAWMISMHHRDQLQDRINHLNDKLDALNYRIHRIEHPEGIRLQDGAITTTTINPDGFHIKSQDDVLAAWDDIINTTRKGERL